MRIGLDAMGGDFAPESPLKGIDLALTELKSAFDVHLYGPGHVLDSYTPVVAGRVVKVEAPDVIEMGESPTKAIMKKPNSSIALALAQLKAGHIDMFISAGNTGAVLVGAMYTVKATEGVIRPAIASYVPNLKGGFSILLDVGANPDAKPDVLHQFAILGSLYAQYMFNKPTPKVGLINIGSEAEKGSLVAQAAYNLFKDSDKIHFGGNMEGYDVFTGEYDVMVCDGFVGNVLLKTAESLYKIFGSKLHEDPFIKKFDYQYYGGTPILGINKPVLIGHGISSPRAFVSMISQGVEMVNSGLVEKVKTTFEP
ncbi:MAG: phosphate acyltransferase PlsX [Bacteroidetes bacterium]|nr:phosphate acyltransferase PlsX [Bacteroidota bacterium]